jgi:hypothetical protein
MPREADLPHSIAHLSRCQYRRLDHRQFSVNMGLIVADLQRMLGPSGSGEKNPPPARQDGWSALDGTGVTTWPPMQPNHRQHP